MNIIENHIVDIALENFRNATHLKAVWKKGAPKQVDGQVEFFLDGHKHAYYAEIKNEIRNHQLPQLLYLAKQYGNLIVIANHIFPNIKEELQRNNIAWLEANGNVCIRNKGIHIWVNTNKAIQQKEKPNRAFTKTGLKAVFHFLIDEEAWLNLPYREMANRMGIGLGNINYIMHGLKQTGYLIKLDKRKYRLTNKKALFEKWMAAYKERLQPVLETGTFRFLKDEDFLHWKNLKLTPTKTFWGGEPGGDLYTHYLRPGILTLYTKETRAEIIKNYRLIPDPNGNVKVYQKFYEFTRVNDNVVHPLLVYADLMNTGNRRCQETAEKLYNECLRDQF